MTKTHTPDPDRTASARRLMGLLSEALAQMTDTDGHPTLVGRRLIRVEATVWESHGWLPFAADELDRDDFDPDAFTGTAHDVAGWFQNAMLAGQATHQLAWCERLAEHLVGELAAHQLSPYMD